MSGAAPPAGPHRFPIRVYFEDTDTGGVVYHANYLRFAERARTECLRDLGLPHSEMIARHASILVVQRVEVEYLRPARLDDALVVETVLVRLRGASMRLVQTVRRQDGGGDPEAGAAARLVVDLVCVGQDSLRPVPIPAPWRDALRGLVTEEPAGGGRAAGRRAGEDHRGGSLPGPGHATE